MGHCLRFVVTSRVLSSVGDIHVVQILVKPYVPSDKLEGSSVVNSVVDKLFVECFYFLWCVCACFLAWCLCGNVHFWFIQPG